MVMPPTRRHNRKPKGLDPELLAAQLPTRLRTFTDWYRDDSGDPTGIREYTTALTEWLDSGDLPRGLTTPVMHAGELTVANWYLTMLSKST
ncbi:Uncharacterised protein [Mycobacteroides abscessus subsp. abscessus]|nr:Uncharacterised protein [Mycobacteroides abscessus subsp. abscessus]